MHFIDQQTRDNLRKWYPKGTRVELVKMDDPQAPPPGTLGTVTGVDDAGTIHTDWDNGSSLGLAYPEDQFRKVVDQQETGLIKGKKNGIVSTPQKGAKQMTIKEQETMSVMEMIRTAISEKKMKQKDFAAAIGKPASNVSSQMHDGYLKAEDWRVWAKALGYKVVMIPDEEISQK